MKKTKGMHQRQSAKTSFELQLSWILYEKIKNISNDIEKVAIWYSTGLKENQLFDEVKRRCAATFAIFAVCTLQFLNHVFKPSLILHHTLFKHISHNLKEKISFCQSCLLLVLILRFFLSESNNKRKLSFPLEFF